MRPRRCSLPPRERTRGYPRALEALAAILAADRSTTLEEVLADAETAAARGGGRGAGRRGVQPPRSPRPAGDAGARRSRPPRCRRRRWTTCSSLMCRASTAPRCCAGWSTCSSPGARPGASICTRSTAAMPWNGSPRARPPTGTPRRPPSPASPCCIGPRSTTRAFAPPGRAGRPSTTWRPSSRNSRCGSPARSMTPRPRCCSRSTSTTCCYGAMHGSPPGCTNA